MEFESDLPLVERVAVAVDRRGSSDPWADEALCAVNSRVAIDLLYEPGVRMLADYGELLNRFVRFVLRDVDRHRREYESDPAAEGQAARHDMLYCELADLSTLTVGLKGTSVSDYGRVTGAIQSMTELSTRAHVVWRLLLG